MRGNQMEQAKLFQWINMVSFAVNDIVLYLDTHPTDQQAIAYFNHFREVRTKALKEYEDKRNIPAPGQDYRLLCSIPVKFPA